MEIHFSKRHFFVTLILFFTEVLIATVLNHLDFLRSYIGDVLVVMLMYYAFGTFFKIRNKTTVLLGIFSFGIFTEVLQYFKIASKLGFSKGSMGYIIIGNTFSAEDIICYAMGCVLVGIIESNR